MEMMQIVLTQMALIYALLLMLKEQYRCIVRWYDGHNITLLIRVGKQKST